MLITVSGVEFAFMFVFMAASAMNSRFVFPSLIAAHFVLARPEYFYAVRSGGMALSRFGLVFLVFWMAALLASFMRS